MRPRGRRTGSSFGSRMTGTLGAHPDASGPPTGHLWITGVPVDNSRDPSGSASGGAAAGQAADEEEVAAAGFADEDDSDFAAAGFASEDDVEVDVEDVEDESDEEDDEDEDDEVSADFRESVR
ncbi:hypothetical protein Prum_048110 [Phytohabitans rumicis]|uniref:Uncharacterized protein n=1 Tax=Phytohabitans rumicis TaxID=1076125 RepID=A0A6V8L9C4_9ACTN|nr:hypothetical protein Prum_048110 [Phytohabitans rumicis]